MGLEVDRHVDCVRSYQECVTCEYMLEGESAVTYYDGYVNSRRYFCLPCYERLQADNVQSWDDAQKKDYREFNPDYEEGDY